MEDVNPWVIDDRLLQRLCDFQAEIGVFPGPELGMEPVEFPKSACPDEEVAARVVLYLAHTFVCTGRQIRLIPYGSHRLSR